MKKPTSGIVVDGSTRGNPGPSEYRGMDLQTGKILFHVKLGIATNNIAEFIGLCHAVFYAVQKGYKEVYSDSQTALRWLVKKQCNSSLPVSEKTKTANDYKNRVLSKLKDMDIIDNTLDIRVEDSVNVSKWYTSEYGEIPADFDLK